MKDLQKIRESYLTEDDIAPKGELFYPQAKQKERAIMKGSKVNERDTFNDLVCGILNPIVHDLNKGKEIKTNSKEHKSLLLLLNKAWNL